MCPHRFNDGDDDDRARNTEHGHDTDLVQPFTTVEHVADRSVLVAKRGRAGTRTYRRNVGHNIVSGEWQSLVREHEDVDEDEDEDAAVPGPSLRHCGCDRGACAGFHPRVEGCLRTGARSARNGRKSDGAALTGWERSVRGSGDRNSVTGFQGESPFRVIKNASIASSN